MGSSASTPERFEWRAKWEEALHSGWNSPPQGKPCMSAKGSILIIDDEQEIRESLEQLLSLEGYAVSTAATAEEGLRKTSETFLDLVLLDVTLPDGNGLD